MTGESFFRGASAPPNPMAAQFRSTCSECGSGDIVWMTASDLVDSVSPDERAHLREGMELTGRDADAWLCTTCGNYGLMSAPQMGS